MIIKSPQEMYDYGKSLVQKSKVLLLYGELGSGKTTLVKGFSDGLGINSEKVQSPTYAYLNIYDNKLLHIDMYRLLTFHELIEKGILNQISEYEYIVIEWPKWESQLDLESPLKINIVKISAQERGVFES